MIELKHMFLRELLLFTAGVSAIYRELLIAGDVYIFSKLLSHTYIFLVFPIQCIRIFLLANGSMSRVEEKDGDRVVRRDTAWKEAKEAALVQFLIFCGMIFIYII